METARTGREDWGSTLLFLHCARLTALHEAPPSALERLRALLGDELAELLVEGLSLAGPKVAV